MTTQYTPILALALPVTGELSGTWGDVVNDNITSMVEQAIAGLATINTWAGNGHTLTTANGTTSESRCAMLVLTDTGVALTGAATVICPTASKIYIVKNTSGQSATITTAAGTGVSIPNGETMFVFCDGTNVVQAVTRIASADVDFAKLKGTGAVVVTNILDEDNMASDSATALATQQSIKAYVDSQISANNDLSEVLANGNTTGGTDIVVSTGDSVQVTDLTASVAVFTDASKNLVSNAITGTGNVVMSTSPTLVTPALGTPASGVVTNLTGTASININGTVGASTPSTGAFTTLSASGTSTLAAVNSGALAVTGAISSTTDATLSGVRVGKGAGAVASNTAVGSGALNANTTGGTNAAYGVNALYSNITGGANAAYGVNALYSNTTGGNNTASGTSALFSNTTGSSNTATGPSALGGNTTGSNNTASGVNALYSNTTGNNNTASGFSALSSNTTGNNNTASGHTALNSNTTGINNTASGQGALYNNTTGSSNTATGPSALLYNTTGTSNTASGTNALYSNTTGNNNTASGFSALSSNTTGNNNTASGHTALNSNTTGINNTASGQGALYNNTTGNYNTASGQSALLYNTTGTSNTASGTNALYSNTTGNNNTASGFSALSSNTTGSGNTAINPLNSAGTYTPVFDPTTENHRFCMGSTAVTNAYIQVAWTVVSDARDKINFAPVPHGLEFVKALHPTAYQFRTARDSEKTNGGVRYGFKAQDVLELEGANPVIVDNEDADKLRMVDTALIPVLVKALQELNAKFDAYVLTHP